MKESWKRLGLVLGLVSGMFGLMWLPGILCWLGEAVTTLSFSPRDSRNIGMFVLAGIGLFGGGGFLLFELARRSLAGRASVPLRLPGLVSLAAVFGFVLLLGELLRESRAGAILFPFFFLAAAGLPPLLAFRWSRQPDGLEEPGHALTWRRFWVSVLAGGGLGILLALAIEAVGGFFIYVLGQIIFGTISQAWQGLLTELAGGNVARALGSPVFIIGLISAGLLAPLVEELVKPLGLLPLLQQAPGRRAVFWMGAAAGLGFAAVENLFYTGFGVSSWAGIVVLRVLGAAIHPLGAGLVALGWYEALQLGVRTPEGRSAWLRRFVPAAGLHALWNSGSLIVLALVEGNLFGTVIPFGLPGLSISAVLLAFLVVVGLGAFMALRRLPQSLDEARLDAGPTGSARPSGRWKELQHSLALDSEQTLAIWGAACLVIGIPLVIWLVW